MQLAITHYTATSAAGTGLAPLRDSIAGRKTGLRRNDFPGCDLDTWIGRVNDVEGVSIPEAQIDQLSRNNQLAWMGLQQDGLLDAVKALRERLGENRIGVAMGTSTSSIGRTEEAYTCLEESGEMAPEYRQPQVHNLHSPGLFVAAATGLTGPNLTVSTACSSSAKVFATAMRWINYGLVDAVLVGGIDTLCHSVLYGFNSLELVSSEKCRPFDNDRNGINIGEAAGYALLVRPDLADDSSLFVAGYGESSDAHHMSHPHPEGKGAALAMRHAIERAGVQPDDVGYINLHGTASQANDRIEALALANQFSTQTLASSTKGWTGHTLGAAGILESVIAIDTLVTGVIPGTLNCERLEDGLAFPIITDNAERDIRCSMTNSFGFGGNNASLVFRSVHD